MERKKLSDSHWQKLTCTFGFALCSSPIYLSKVYKNEYFHTMFKKNFNTKLHPFQKPSQITGNIKKKTDLQLNAYTLYHCNPKPDPRQAPCHSNMKHRSGVSFECVHFAHWNVTLMTTHCNYTYVDLYIMFCRMYDSAMRWNEMKFFTLGVFLHLPAPKEYFFYDNFFSSQAFSSFQIRLELVVPGLAVFV